MKKLVFQTITCSLLLLGTLAHAETIPLAGTWEKYDPASLWTLTDQSANAFTANVTPNETGDPGARPVIYQTFEGVPFTSNGARVQVEFDVVFNDVAASWDTQWRFGAGYTNHNEDIWVGYDIGSNTGTSIRERMDCNNGQFSPTIVGNGISEDTNFVGQVTGQYGTYDVLLHDPALWNSAYSASYNLFGWDNSSGGTGFASAGGAPNGLPNRLGLDTNVVHHFVYSLERTPAAMLQRSVWSNEVGGTNSYIGVAGFYADTALSIYSPTNWQSVNMFGFGFTQDAMFGAGTSGSYTVSNLKVTTGFGFTSVSRDSGTGDVILTWQSSPCDSALDLGVSASYVVQCATNMESPTWVSISTNHAPTTAEGFWTSATNAATTDAAAFYRVQKVYTSN